MGLLGKVFNTLNPVNLVSKVFGGTIGSLFEIGKALITGIAQGKKFGEILKDCLKPLAMLAIKAALMAFTGGTAAVFVDKLVGVMQGFVGKLIGQVAGSALSDGVKKWITDKLGSYAESLGSKAFKDTLTRAVVDAAGLKGPDDVLDKNRLSDSFIGKIGQVFVDQVDHVLTPDEQNATIYSIDPDTYRDRSYEKSAYDPAQKSYDQVIGRGT